MMTALSPETKSPEEVGRPSAPTRLVWVGLVVLYLVLRGFALFDLEAGGDLRVYWAAAEAWREGVALWREHPFEYPPAALLMVLPPAWWVDDLSGYVWAFAGWALLIDLAVVAGVAWLAAGAERDLWRSARTVGLYLVLTGLLGELLVQRLDVGVALAGVLCSVLLRARASRVAVLALLGVLTLFKLVGVLLAPLLVLQASGATPPDRPLPRWAAFVGGGRYALSTLAIAALGATPFLAAAGAWLLEVLRYHSARGLQLESTWSSVLLIARRLFAFELRVGFNFGATHLAGEVASVLSTLNPIVLVLALVVVFDRVRARQLSFERGALALWLTFLLASKVLSPQFLLWIAPWLAWQASASNTTSTPSEGGRPPGWPSRQLPLMVGVYFLTGFLMHFGYGRLAALDALAGVLLALRNVGLLLLLLGTLGIEVRSPLSGLAAHWQRWVAAVAAVCLVVLAAVRDITSFDFWLHRFLGAQIVATQRIPTIDAFSAATEGHTFVAHEWLSAVLLFLVDDVAGAPGLIVLRALVLAGMVALLHATVDRTVRRQWWWWLLLAAALIVFRARLQLRPHLFAMLIMAAAVFLLHRARRGRSRAEREGEAEPTARRWFGIEPALLGLVPLEVLWANLHASCILLPLMLFGVAAAGALTERPSSACRGTSSWGWFAVAVACALATLCNPRGATLWSFALSLFISETPRLFVDEWRGAVAAYEGTSFQIAFVGVVAAYGWSLWALSTLGGPRRALVWPWVVGLTAVALGLTAVRFQAPMAVWLVPELALMLSALTERGVLQSSHSRGRLREPQHRVSADSLSGTFSATSSVTLSDAVGNAIAPSTVAGFAVVGWIAVGFLNAGVLQLDYGRDLPWSASAMLQERGVEGVVFNEYDDGGFLLAHHWPKLRPVVDGRIDVLGDAGVHHYRAARADLDAFARYLEEHRATAVLLRRRLPFNRAHHRWLQRSPAWRQVQTADDRVLYLRRGAPSSRGETAESRP